MTHSYRLRPVALFLQRVGQVIVANEEDETNESFVEGSISGCMVIVLCCF